MSAPSGFLALIKTSATGGHYWETSTGTGLLVAATTPTLTTPVLGIATATSINKVAITAPATSSTITIADGKTLTASNTLTFTGTDASSVAFGTGGTVTYTANKLSVFAATTSAELAGVISNETGSGLLVFNDTPTLATPVLGIATATSINGLTINATTSGVLTIANSSTLATSGAFSITLTSTAGTNVTLPTTGTLATRAGTETFTNKTLTAPILSGDVSLSTDIVAVTGVNHVIRSADATGATESYDMTFSSGTTVSATSGDAIVRSGAVSTLGTSGFVYMYSGNSTVSGNSGNVSIYSGSALTGDSGTVTVSSSTVTTGNTGSVDLITGNTTTGTTGTIDITTGNATTGASGSLIITTGTASTIKGAIFNRATVVSKTAAAPSTCGPGADTITAAELIGGIITMTPTTGATRALTLPTGVDLANALPSSFTTNDSFDVSIINLATAANTDTITLTASVGITIVGQPVVDWQVATVGAVTSSSAVFRIRMSAAATFIAYRIS